MKDLKNICFAFNSKDNVLQVSLPCLPHNEEEHPEKNSQENKTKTAERPLDLWKLKRITDNCLLKIDDNAELLRPEGSYGYGFASKFRGRIKTFDVSFEKYPIIVISNDSHSCYSVI